MRRALLVLVAVFAVTFNLFSAESKSTKDKSMKTEDWKSREGLYAIFDTSMGIMVCELFENETPLTVNNFIGLVKGKKEFIDPKTKKKVKRRYYDGLIFHRIIKNFMIQGGCPLGTGYGGPGYKFKNEIVESLKYDKPGRLAMANAGPDTNGSQFFITEVADPRLNGGYTIFGQLIEGMDILKNIAKVKTNPRNKPMKDVVIKKITIEKVKGTSKTIKKKEKSKKND